MEKGHGVDVEVGCKKNTHEVEVIVLFFVFFVGFDIFVKTVENYW